jgi:hypothetical protein
MSIKTQSAKGKGRRLQNYVRDLILAKFPWLQEGDVDSCSMGSSGVDIQMSPLGRRTIPVSIECKKTRKHPGVAEMKQAAANTYGMTIPAVVWCPHGAGHAKSMITFELDEFLEWYKDIREDYMDKLREQEEDK